MQTYTSALVFLQGGVLTTGSSLILLSLQPRFLPCVGRRSPKLSRIPCENDWEEEIRKERNDRKRWTVCLRGCITGLSENKALKYQIRTGHKRLVYFFCRQTKSKLSLWLLSTSKFREIRHHILYSTHAPGNEQKLCQTINAPYRINNTGNEMQWLAQLPRSKKVLALIPAQGFSVRSLRVFLHACMGFCSSFFPLSKNLHTMLTGDLKVCACVCVCLFLFLI